MVLSRDSKNIPIRPAILEFLSKQWEEDKQKFPEKTHKQLGGYLNDRLNDFIEKLKYLEAEYPNLSYFGIQSETMYIQDAKLDNRFIEVTMKDNRLHCNYHKSTNCDHVFYARSRDEFARLWAAKKNQSLIRLGSLRC